MTGHILLQCNSHSGWAVKLEFDWNPAEHQHSPNKKMCSHVLSSAGTTERVCLIQGTVEALNSVHDFIAEKVREMPQSAAKTEPVSILQPQTTVNPDRIKQVRPCILRSCS